MHQRPRLHHDPRALGQRPHQLDVGGVNYGFAGDATAQIGGGLMIAGSRSGPLRIDYFIESGYGVGKDAAGGYEFVPIIGGLTYSVSKP